jgi:hypothetical protein
MDFRGLGDPMMQSEIRRCANEQAKLSLQPERGALEHTGAGTGSGKYGFCPGMIQGTRVSVDNLADGARLRVRAPSEREARALQRSTHERLKKLEEER